MRMLLGASNQSLTLRPRVCTTPTRIWRPSSRVTTTVCPARRLSTSPPQSRRSTPMSRLPSWLLRSVPAVARGASPGTPPGVAPRDRQPRSLGRPLPAPQTGPCVRAGPWFSRVLEFARFTHNVNQVPEFVAGWPRYFISCQSRFPHNVNQVPEFVAGASNSRTVSVARPPQR